MIFSVKLKGFVQDNLIKLGQLCSCKKQQKYLWRAVLA